MALNRASFMSLFLLFTLVAVSSAIDLPLFKPKHEIKAYGAYGSSLEQNYRFQEAEGKSLLKDLTGKELAVDGIDIQLKEGEFISEVHVRHGSMVDAIGFLVTRPATTRSTLTSLLFGSSDESSYSVLFGNSTGGELTKIKLHDGVYVTNISGQYGFDNLRKVVAIGKLKIHTNLNPEGFGPYGKAIDIQGLVHNFKSNNDDGAVIGVFGRNGTLVESIGIIVKI